MDTLYLERASQTPWTSLREDYFFQFPHIAELRFAGHQLSHLPTSISQCILLERVNLAGNNFNTPPAVLFTLPLLRAQPSNIIFGHDQACTPAMMHAILDECREDESYSQCLISFLDINDKYRRVSISPSLSVLDFFFLAHPEISFGYKHFYLIRIVDSYSLTIVIDAVPLYLYDYPGAKFSLRLRSVTPELCRLAEARFLLRDFIAPRMAPQPSAELAGVMQALRAEQLTPSKVRDIITRSDALMNPTVTLVLQGHRYKTVAVKVSEDAVRVIVSADQYFVFRHESVRFSFQQEGGVDYPLICFGSKALVLDPTQIGGAVPLLTLFMPPMAPRPDGERRWRFTEIGAQGLSIVPKYRELRAPSEMEALPAPVRRHPAIPHQSRPLSR
jgi:hypothetical protein